MTILYKLLLGKPEYNFRVPHPAIENQKIIIKAIWNNANHNDIGLERLLRLFLASVQFCFPAIYMRHLLWKMGYAYQSIAIECYVLIKTATPLAVFYFNLYHYHFFVWLIIYQLTESIFYIATLIFVSDQLIKPRSYRRSILLLMIDYAQITFDFAIVYAGLNLLNANAKTVLDHIYFSFVTSATIGFGDIYPLTAFGKSLVCIQSIIFFVFVGLFINYFNSKVDNTNFDEKFMR